MDSQNTALQPRMYLVASTGEGAVPQKFRALTAELALTTYLVRNASAPKEWDAFLVHDIKTGKSRFYNIGLGYEFDEGASQDAVATLIKLAKIEDGTTHIALVHTDNEGRRFVIATTPICTPASAMNAALYRIGSLVLCLRKDTYKGVDIDECDTLSVRFATDQEMENPTPDMLFAPNVATDRIDDGYLVITR